MKRRRHRARSSLVASWPPACSSGMLPGPLPQAPRRRGPRATDAATMLIAARRVPRARRRLRGLPHAAAAARPSPAAARCPRRSARSTSPNITPDDETGIGSWTADDFYRMLHTGVSTRRHAAVSGDAVRIYTKVTRADSDAIYAYLMSVPPVKQPNRPHELRFPFNQRDAAGRLAHAVLPARASTCPTRSSRREWNRGAYLVQGLGHCAMCHTAINALGGSSEVEGVRGRHDPEPELVRAFAHVQPRSRPGRLGASRTSRTCCRPASRTRGTVYGPMAEVVYNSLQYLTDEDVRAMAVYLKSLPQTRVRAAAHEPGAPGRARR